MTVNQYKQKYGDRAFSGFFYPEYQIVRVPEYPTDLYHMVDDTLREIDRYYLLGVGEWMGKNKKWKEIWDKEEAINVAIITNDKEYLKLLLEEYKVMWIKVNEEYEAWRLR